MLRCTSMDSPINIFYSHYIVHSNVFFYQFTIIMGHSAKKCKYLKWERLKTIINNKWKALLGLRLSTFYRRSDNHIIKNNTRARPRPNAFNILYEFLLITPLNSLCWEHYTLYLSSILLYCLENETCVTM